MRRIGTQRGFLMSEFTQMCALQSPHKHQHCAGSQPDPQKVREALLHVCWESQGLRAWGIHSICTYTIHYTQLTHLQDGQLEVNCALAERSLQAWMVKS